jgi:hypothetical protein
VSNQALRNDPMLPLPGLSPVAGKKVVVKFDGGLLSSDGGIVVLREVEQRLRVADRMAACLVAHYRRQLERRRRLCGTLEHFSIRLGVS